MSSPTPAALTTARLILRRWRDADRPQFAALNADPEVMRYFAAPLDRAASDAFVDRIEQGFDEHGYGLWALEVRATGEFLGFTGLALQTFEAPFTPAVEVGWRLARSAWGQGYATEAARAALAYGFGFPVHGLRSPEDQLLRRGDARSESESCGQHSLDDPFLRRCDARSESQSYGLRSLDDPLLRRGDDRALAGLDEIISITTRTNVASQAVMQRLGMTTRPEDDFEYSRLPEGHPLRPHVLYRLNRVEWAQRVSAD